MPSPGRASRRRSDRDARTRPADGLPDGPVTTTTGVCEVVPDRDDPRLVTLLLDGVPSSALHLDDPARLDFEYMQQMAASLELLPAGPLDVVHLGAAGCAMARHLDAVRPGSRQLAVDVDEGLLELVRGWFDLPRSPRLRLRPGDAREVLGSLPPGSADVIVRDVFAGARTPEHLTTVEFADDVARVLRPGGLYLANVADRPPLGGARAEAAAVLGHPVSASGMALVAEPAVLRGRRYGNLVMVCVRGGTGDVVDLADLVRIGRRLPVPVRVLLGDEVRTFVGTSRPAHDPA